MRHHLTFALNGEIVDVRDIAPTTTLLQWLRRSRRLTGTKEGCAEGDCGACSVVVARLRDGKVEHATIDACIAFLPMLDGTSITTVEGVAGPAGALHPCQQAMVDCHGSQCGFCTPGFIMTLYALHLSHVSAPADIESALAGNLCRCTGYGPINDAARAMFDHPRPKWLTDRIALEERLLQKIQDADPTELVHAKQRLHVPTTEDELAQLFLANPNAKLISGATDAGLWVTKKGETPPLLIATHRALPSVRTALPNSLAAGTTHADAARWLNRDIPALAELWRRFAGPQIRNLGTVGGNIANGSPIGDLAPAFIALGAELHLRHGDRRRKLPLEDFFLAYGKQDCAPGEFITGLSWGTAHGDPAQLQVHKVSKRFDDDISAVCGAFLFEIQDNQIRSVRIAYGGMAATPKRARAVESALIGKPWRRATIDAALAAFTTDFQPISDTRASATYRLQVAQNLLIRSFLERADPASAPSLAIMGAA